MKSVKSKMQPKIKAVCSIGPSSHVIQKRMILSAFWISWTKSAK